MPPLLPPFSVYHFLADLGRHFTVYDGHYWPGFQPVRSSFIGCDVGASRNKGKRVIFDVSAIPSLPDVRAEGGVGYLSDEQEEGEDEQEGVLRQGKDSVSDVCLRMAQMAMRNRTLLFLRLFSQLVARALPFLNRFSLLRGRITTMWSRSDLSQSLLLLTHTGTSLCAALLPERTLHHYHALPSPQHSPGLILHLRALSDQGEREMTFSSDGDDTSCPPPNSPKSLAHKSLVPMSSGFSSPAQSFAFTPTPAFPRPRARFNLPPPPSGLLVTPKPEVKMSR
ncbi:uncharacterized protein ARMOST_15049 [Armillaria ostoyae]|uniref:Uncharacterized protein n=1 Tax=Armillaria ostoyae TaxID=47428 RepID=A0A284RSB6_ARMOS|nr:uncharacterized protein ARMOST_15049 [Armillaria ostoyae]